MEEITPDYGLFHAPEPNEEQARHLEHLRMGWFSTLDRLYALQTTPRRYLMRTTTGQVVELGTTADLMNQRALRTRVLDQTGALPVKIHQEYWESTVEKIVGAAIPIEAPEAGERDRLLAWLAAYLEENRPAVPGGQEYDANMRYAAPIFRRGMVCVSVTHLVNWLGDRGWSAKPEEMAVLFRKYGFIHYRVTARLPTLGMTHRRYWGVPSEFVPDTVKEFLIKEMGDDSDADTQAN